MSDILIDPPPYAVLSIQAFSMHVISFFLPWPFPKSADFLQFSFCEIEEGNPAPFTFVADLFFFSRGFERSLPKEAPCLSVRHG